jgi:multimeric flavodoxin WrbA
MKADILIFETPIWLGDKSSLSTGVVERLYAESWKMNKFGKCIYYDKAGG